VKTETLNLQEWTRLRGSKIGFVFQSFHLLTSKTVLENVTLAGMYTGVPRAVRFERSNDAVEKVGLGHRRDFLPNRLSDGEKQRVAVARALSGQP
jgi:putative ABC transport system ATP-binding protein